MKYVVSQIKDQIWIAQGGFIDKMNCMCYKPSKMMWFDSIDDAKDMIHKLNEEYEKSNKLRFHWERIYASKIQICEAIISRHTNQYGNSYTTTECGAIVEEVPINY